eukprot:1150489-Pelagomonas_calceolata.AAC.2
MAAWSWFASCKHIVPEQTRTFRTNRFNVHMAAWSWFVSASTSCQSKLLCQYLNAYGRMLVTVGKQAGVSAYILGYGVSEQISGLGASNCVPGNGVSKCVLVYGVSKCIQG